MITALLAAAALQIDPSAFASACAASGGAPGRLEAASDQETYRRFTVVNGREPVALMISVNRVEPGRMVFVYANGSINQSIHAGGSGVATGRWIEFMAAENQSFDYCLRFQSR